MVALEAWWPKYLEIINRFGYSLEADQYAADVLSQMISEKVLDPALVAKRVTNKKVLLCGAGPSLPSNLDDFTEYEQLKGVCIISANGATTALVERGLQPDIVVTDLDGHFPDIIRTLSAGAFIVVHAHGDNIPALEASVPTFLDAICDENGIIGSTQAQPRAGVLNFGGFTDGDRGVFLAEELHAQVIGLIGMDLGNIVGRYSKPPFISDQPATPLKREKLLVARELLMWLASWSRSKLINFTNSPHPIAGIPNQPITKEAWEINEKEEATGGAK